MTIRLNIVGVLVRLRHGLCRVSRIILSTTIVGKTIKSILEAANLFQGRSNGAYENSKGRIGEENGGREETEREKQKRLEDWARENNLWIDNLDNTLEANFGHSINSGGGGCHLNCVID